MARRMNRRKRSVRPSVSIAGYTRPVALGGSTAASNATSLTTTTVADVDNLSGETTNRKLIRVAGKAIFTAALPANKNVMAQFCLWAAPQQESWPTISAYDPFTEGPGESGFQGMLAPRVFCRRTFVLATPPSGEAQTITEAHVIRSKAERLLRPGWILQAGLYIRGSSGISVSHHSLLRYVVAG